MSPFKVIRCRYYTEDGKAVPPYCSAGRHCTFLHPNDKGWPGGDPIPEIEKRSEDRDRTFDRSRSRMVKGPDHLSSLTHERRISRPRAATIPVLDFSSENLPQRKSNSHPSFKDVITPVPVHSIVQAFHDIAKYQLKLTQDNEALDKAMDKVSSFRELSRSLSKVSATSAAAVAPTLDAIVDARQALQRKVDDDMKQISDLWDHVFNIFLRAICRQFDNELESGTDYLRQEARILLKSFPLTTNSYRHFEDTAPARPSSTRTQSKLHSVESQTGHSDVGEVSPGESSKERAFHENNTHEEKAAVINPPVGKSDNGWGHKRRRLSSGSLDHSGQMLGEASEIAVRDAIAELQKQLKEQSEKIVILARRNEELESTVNHYSGLTQTAVHASDSHPDSHKSFASPLSDGQLSRIRDTVREDVLALISPILEKQKQVNESWETRLCSLSAKLRKMDMGRSAEDDIVMAPPLQDNSPRQQPA